MPKPPPSICFNEIDPFLGQWLKNLWPNSFVNVQDIRCIGAKILKRYKRVHLFAGIGGWEYAFMLAGWPKNRPVWSGSCPCQPFSCAGKKKGVNDERHLWPEFYRLIKECKPSTVFGEQVASKLGREWLSGVRSDMESLGYAFGAADLPTACVGSPHIRQRLWWVATLGVGNTDSNECYGPVKRPTKKAKRRKDNEKHSKRRRTSKSSRASVPVRLGDTNCERRDREPVCLPTRYQKESIEAAWSSFCIVICTDGKAKRVPIEPGVFPLAHGVPSRVGRLRAYGNANCPQVAALFIRSFLQAETEASRQFSGSVSL